MSYMKEPQNNIDPSRVFDKGCCESRVRELSNLIIAQLVSDDAKAWAREQRKAGELPSPYPFDEIAIRERFFETAKAEAVRIIEEERRLCVEARTDYIRNTLNIAIKRLRFLTMTDKGTKGKIYVKRMSVQKGSWERETRQIPYFETLDGGIERVQEIGAASARLSEFVDYLPYVDEELKKLYDEAQDLANIETVFLDDQKEKVKTETEAQAKEE